MVVPEQWEAMKLAASVFVLTYLAEMFVFFVFLFFHHLFTKSPPQLVTGSRPAARKEEKHVDPVTVILAPTKPKKEPLKSKSETCNAVGKKGDVEVAIGAADGIERLESAGGSGVRISLTCKTQRDELPKSPPKPELEQKSRPLAEAPTMELETPSEMQTTQQQRASGRSGRTVQAKTTPRVPSEQMKTACFEVSQQEATQHTARLPVNKLARLSANDPVHLLIGQSLVPQPARTAPEYGQDLAAPERTNPDYDKSDEFTPLIKKDSVMLARY